MRQSHSNFLLCAALFCLAPFVHAQSATDASRASVNVSIGIPVAATAASAHFFRDAGQLSVASVQASGKVTTVVLKGAQSGAEFSVQVASKGLEGSALAAGIAITAVASTTGHLLMQGGKALMFVPNETGRSLLHRSRAREA